MDVDMDPKIDTTQLLSQATAQTPKAGKGKNPQQFKEVCQQFESIFIQLLVNNISTLYGYPVFTGIAPHNNGNICLHSFVYPLRFAELYSNQSKEKGLGFLSLPRE